MLDDAAGATPDVGADEAPAIIPFHSYLWKVASRCNLDCDYCYIYHLADQRWRDQPKLMSEETARQTARRIREHLIANGKEDLLITFHGGEPMLIGADRLRRFLKIIDEELSSRGFHVKLSMQSNLTLLNEELADVLLEYNVRVGTSLDGPQEVNDLARLDHKGRSSSAATEAGISLLGSPRYRELMGGILCVINPESDPKTVVDHLASFAPGEIDFLFPLGNHDRPPKGKIDDPDATPYADWLIQAFDHWWGQGAQSTSIRIFETIMSLSCGFGSKVESFGLGVIDLVVVETNGDIEGLDSLKGTFDGATVLGLDVFQNTFDEAAQHSMVRLRQSGIDEVCDTCKTCPVVKVCGGGYIPHRYSEEQGFANPSVYCRDLEKLIRHIHGTLKAAVELLSETGSPA